MTRNSKLLVIGASIGLASALAGCGGGGDDSPPQPAVTAAVPASASVNVSDFIGYLQQLVVSSADTLEPVDVSAVTPPTSDTTEPAVVN